MIRKFILFSMATVFAMSFVNCSSGSDNEKTPEEQKEEEEQTTEKGSSILRAYPSFNEDVLKYYNIIATYTGSDGTIVTDKITNENATVVPEDKLETWYGLSAITKINATYKRDSVANFWKGVKYKEITATSKLKGEVAYTAEYSYEKRTDITVPNDSTYLMYCLAFAHYTLETYDANNKMINSLALKSKGIWLYGIKAYGFETDLKVACKALGRNLSYSEE